MIEREKKQLKKKIAKIFSFRVIFLFGLFVGIFQITDVRENIYILSSDEKNEIKSYALNKLINNGLMVKNLTELNLKGSDLESYNYILLMEAQFFSVNELEKALLDRPNQKDLLIELNENKCGFLVNKKLFVGSAIKEVFIYDTSTMKNSDTCLMNANLDSRNYHLFGYKIM